MEEEEVEEEVKRERAGWRRGEEEEEKMRGGLNISLMNEAVCLATEGAVGEEPDVFDHQSAETRAQTLRERPGVSSRQSRFSSGL